MAKKALTILEEETSFDGDLTFSSSVSIKGRFNGTIKTEGTLTVDRGAVVTADITAGNLIISGEVTGDCTVNDKLEMTDDAYLKGNIRAKMLKIADGVVFDGNCEMIK